MQGRNTERRQVSRKEGRKRARKEYREMEGNNGGIKESYGCSMRRRGGKGEMKHESSNTLFILLYLQQNTVSN